VILCSISIRGSPSHQEKSGSLGFGRKGKFLRGFVDKLITFAKKGDLSSRRVCIRMMNNSDTVKKLFDEIGPAGYDRNGGHTRLIKYKNRHGDGAELVIVELIK